MSSSNDWIGMPSNYKDFFGFVYLITNLRNGNKYVGQKKFFRVVKKPFLKNKLSKKVLDKISVLNKQYNDGVITSKVELARRISDLKRKERVRRSGLTQRSRSVVVESDWRDYYGSSQSLLFDVERFGKDSFRREVIWLCTSQWWLTYLELKEQLFFNAIFRDDFYNGIINVRLANVVKFEDFDLQLRVFDDKKTL